MGTENDLMVKLLQLALEYERRLRGVGDVLRTYDRMKQQVPSMSPETAIELIRDAIQLEKGL